jgi:hypothetical protein
MCLCLALGPSAALMKGSCMISNTIHNRGIMFTKGVGWLRACAQAWRWGPAQRR